MQGDSGPFWFGIVIGVLSFWAFFLTKEGITFIRISAFIGASLGAITLQLFPAGTAMLNEYLLGVAAGFLIPWILWVVFRTDSSTKEELSWDEATKHAIWSFKNNHHANIYNCKIETFTVDKGQGHLVIRELIDTSSGFKPGNRTYELMIDKAGDILGIKPIDQ